MMEVSDLGRNVTYKVSLPGGQARLKEAALYVMKKCEGLPFFGLVKLNKILWRADFQSFRERRSPVTGRQYQRIENGPAPVEMRPILNDLLSRNEIELRHTDVPNEQRPYALVEPNTQHFSAYDLRYLDQAIEYFAPFPATKVSDMSHGVAWASRENGDLLPYDSAYLDDRPMATSLRPKLADMARQRQWRTA